MPRFILAEALAIVVLLTFLTVVLVTVATLSLTVLAAVMSSR